MSLSGLRPGHDAAASPRRGGHDGKHDATSASSESVLTPRAPHPTNEHQ